MDNLFELFAIAIQDVPINKKRITLQIKFEFGEDLVSLLPQEFSNKINKKS